MDPLFTKQTEIFSIYYESLEVVSYIVYVWGLPIDMKFGKRIWLCRQNNIIKF